MYDEEEIHNLPEITIGEIICKVEELTGLIYGDWSDPRSELREILRLTNKLKEMMV